MKKIDIHCHTTHRDLRNRGMSLATIPALTAEMDRHDVSLTVLLATYFPQSGSGISNFRLLDWIHVNPRFRMFGSLDMQHYFYQGYNELEELAAQKKIAGIKFYTGYQEIDLASSRFRDLVNLAHLHRLPLMFHTGYTRGAFTTSGRIAYTQAVKASDLKFLSSITDVPVILSHMTNPAFDDLRETCKHQHSFYTDVSGLIDSRQYQHEIPMLVEEVRRFAEEVGPQQLLFGTDFPVQTHEDSIRFVEEGMRNFSLTDKQRVYYGNAEYILGGAYGK